MTLEIIEMKKKFWTWWQCHWVDESEDLSDEEALIVNGLYNMVVGTQTEEILFLKIIFDTQSQVRDSIRFEAITFYKMLVVRVDPRELATGNAENIKNIKNINRKFISAAV